MTQVNASLLDGIDHVAGSGIEHRARKVDELVIVVHAVLHAGRDVCREVIDRERAVTDGVHLLPLMVYRVREGQWLVAQRFDQAA